MWKIIVLGVSLLSLAACQTTKNENDTSQPEKKKQSAASINTQLGMAYFEQNHDPNRAKQKLLRALELDPNLPEAWYSMGYVLEKTGNSAEAQKYYLKAIALAPNRGDTHNNYGTYLCRIGDYKGAMEHFMLAVKDPNYLAPASAYENAGLCALKIPDHNLAVGYFNKALNEDPTRLASIKELNRLKTQQTV